MERSELAISPVDPANRHCAMPLRQEDTSGIAAAEPSTNLSSKQLQLSIDDWMCYFEIQGAFEEHGMQYMIMRVMLPESMVCVTLDDRL